MEPPTTVPQALDHRDPAKSTHLSNFSSGVQAFAWWHTIDEELHKNICEPSSFWPDDDSSSYQGQVAQPKVTVAAEAPVALPLMAAAPQELPQPNGPAAVILPIQQNMPPVFPSNA